MSRVEARFCRSSAWEAFARHAVLPRAVGEQRWSGSVLEVGGGTGAVADELLDRERGIDRLVLVDVDPDMVALARERLVRHGDRAAALLSTGAALPVTDGSFGTVCSWLMLHHVLDWETMVREFHRALAPGGRLVGYDLAAGPLGHLLHGMSRSEYRLIRPDELRRALADLGFVDVAVEPVGMGQLMTVHARRPSEPEPGGS